MINILSLGAGVQSSAMLLMAITGEIKHMPDCAIFADTGWEPNYIYDHLNYLEKMAPFPIYRVHNGSLRADILDPLKKRKASLPYYTLASNQTKGMLRRQCTQEYKIMPIDIKIKELLGIKPYQRIKKIKAHLWIGISTDEIVRMKPHHKKYIKNIWP